MSQKEIIGGEFYLFDKKNVYTNLLRMTGSIIVGKVRKCSQEGTPVLLMIILLGAVLLFHSPSLIDSLKVSLHTSRDTSFKLFFILFLIEIKP